MDIMTDVLVKNWIELSLMGNVNGSVCISNYAAEFRNNNNKQKVAHLIKYLKTREVNHIINKLKYQVT